MKLTVAALGLFFGMAVCPLARVSAHCDTMNGPVIVTAKAALEKGNVTPVLKWVGKDDEDVIRQAFKETLAVRKRGREAKELADRYFFETLVRIHRAGEGAPYTGLKSVQPEEAVEAADKALEMGSVGDLAKDVSSLAEKGVRERFEKAMEMKKRSEESVEAGRAYVKAYIEYVHYVERLHKDIAGSGGGHDEHQEGGNEHAH